MIRAVLSVIAGWLTMTIGVIIVFGVTMLVLGASGVYRPGTYWTTNTFNIIVLVGGFTGAVLGGAVCELIARSRKPAMILAALTLGFGLVSGVLNMQKPDPEPPAGERSFEEGMKRGKEPVWFGFAAPFLGAAGILVGSALMRRKAGAAPPTK